MLVTAVAALSLASDNNLRVLTVIDAARTVPGLTVGALGDLNAIQELIFHLGDVIFSILRELHRDLLENHVVLGQSSRLV